jgi:hypothetical protein
MKVTKEIWGIFHFQMKKNLYSNHQQIDSFDIQKIMNIFQHGRELVTITDVEGLLVKHEQYYIQLNEKLQAEKLNHQQQAHQLETKIDQLIALLQPTTQYK